MNEPMKVQERLEAALKRAVAMKRGENLERLLEAEAGELKTMFFKEALVRRQQAACDEADFPPSSLSALRARGDAGGGDQGAFGADAGRKSAV